MAYRTRGPASRGSMVKICFGSKFGSHRLPSKSWEPPIPLIRRCRIIWLAPRISRHGGGWAGLARVNIRISPVGAQRPMARFPSGRPPDLLCKQVVKPASWSFERSSTRHREATVLQSLDHLLLVQSLECSSLIRQRLFHGHDSGRFRLRGRGG